jgi:hypothetical protein
MAIIGNIPYFLLQTQLFLMFRPRKHQDMAEELVLLDNGCICCTVRGDLIQTLHNIGKRFASGQVE